MKVLTKAGKGGPSRGAPRRSPCRPPRIFFCGPAAHPLRKGVEIGIALVLGKLWSKAR